MNENTWVRQLKGLYVATVVNVAIWAIAIVALVILLHRGGNPKGMFVILAGGTAVGIQLVALVSRLKNP